MDTAEVTRKIYDAVNEFGESLDNLRDHIADNRQQAEALESATLPLNEAKAQLKDWIQKRASLFEAEGNLPTGDFLNANCATGNTQLVDPKRLTDFLCWLHGPTIEKKVSAVLAIDVDPNALGTEQKSAELARLAEERHELETAEEQVIRAAEDAGIRLLRRPDADPAIVLAD